MGWTVQNLCVIEEMVLSCEIFGPLKIFFGTNNELEFTVDNRESGVGWKVCNVKRIGGSRIRSFHTNNFFNARIDRAGVKRSTGLERRRLEQRLPACEADVASAVTFDFSNSRRERERGSP